MKQKLIGILFAAAMLATASPSRALAQECTEHQWGEWRATTAPTCDFDGGERRICGSCYEEEYRTVPATGHQWGEWETVEKPTCSMAGYKIKKCTVCGISEREGIPATKDHIWGEWEIDRKPTCFYEGSKVKKCSICHKEKEQEIPKSQNHSWGKWKTAKKATALSDGKKARYCKYCDKEDTKAIPKLKAKISLKEKSVTVEAGKSHTIKIKSKTYGDKVKEWVSSNKNIATVSSSGKVVGNQAGTATITLKMKSGVKTTCKIRVTKPAYSGSSPSATVSGSGNSHHSSGSGSNAGHVNPPASDYVWIPNTGEKYHMSGTCGRMKNPRQVPLKDAERAGYTPCSKCC